MTGFGSSQSDDRPNSYSQGNTSNKQTKKVHAANFDDMKSIDSVQSHASVSTHDDDEEDDKHETARMRFALGFTLPFDFGKFYLIPITIIPGIAIALQQGLWRFEDDLPLKNQIDDVVQVRATMDMIARDVVIVLGLLVTSSFVVLQMFAANFLTHTISLFFRNRSLFLILAFICMSAIFCVVVDTMVHEEFNLYISIRIAYALRMLSLSITFPYFNFLVNFLSSESLIKQVCENAVQCLHSLGKLVVEEKGDYDDDVLSVHSARAWLSGWPKARSMTQDKIEKAVVSHQVDWINAVELLTDIGLSTLKQKDKENANNAMLSLYTIACEYSHSKMSGKVPDSWFLLSDPIRIRPDFSSLSVEVLDNLESKEIWCEWKILRAYQLLLETSNTLDMPNLCGLAAFYTRKIGELAAQRGQREVVEVCIKFLNTYIAYLIHEKNIPVLSGVLNEYRELGVEMVRMDAFFTNMIKEIDSTLSSAERQRKSSVILRSITLARRSMRGHYGNAATNSTSLDPQSLSLHHMRRQRKSLGSIRNEIASARRQSGDATAAGSALYNIKAIAPGRLTNFISGIRGTFIQGQDDFDNRSTARMRSMRSRFVNQKLHYSKMLGTVANNLRQHLVASTDHTLGIIAETIAHDMGEICAEAYKNECEAHEELLAIFLTLDDTQTQSSQRQTHRGIRRSQVKLATYYLVGGDIELAKEIHQDMEEEPMFRIRQIYRELVAMDTENFWEISFRSRNLDYLSPPYRAQLKTFFGWFEDFSFEKLGKMDNDLFDVSKNVHLGVNDEDQEGHSESSLGQEEKDESQEHGSPIAMSTEENDGQERDGASASLCSDRDESEADISMSEKSEAKRRTRASIDVRRRSILESDIRRPSVVKTETEQVLEDLNQKTGSLCWRLQLFGEDGLLRIFINTSLYTVGCLVVGVLLDQWNGSSAVPVSFTQFEADVMISGLAVTSILLYVVLCVSSMIILQLVAARYKFHPDMLSFLRDPILYFILAQIMVSCMLTTMISIYIEEEAVPKRTIRFTIVLIMLNIVLLLVYYTRLFFVLQPDSILNNVQRRTLSHVRVAIGRTNTLRNLKKKCATGTTKSQFLRMNTITARYGPTQNNTTDAKAEQSAAKASLDKLREEVWYHQFQAHEHIKRICDFAFACVQDSDETNLNKAISILLVIIKEYAVSKKKLPDEWFEVRGLLRRTSDFINFSAYRITLVTEQRVWFEWKVLAQYLLIFDECIKLARVDACQAVTLKTGSIAKGFIQANDTNAYRVAINFINTFMRRAINNKSNEVAGQLVMQNYMLMQEIIRTKFDERTEPVVQERWRAIISDQGRYQKYYAQVALLKGLGAIVENVAMSLSQICSVALEVDELVHIDMLELLLTVDDTADGDQDSLVGIRRAQAKLGLKYIITNNESFARMVASDFEVETYSRLKNIVDEMLSTNRAEYWEVSENGLPTEFLSHEEKMQLATFFTFVEEEKAAEELNNPSGSKPAPPLKPYIDEILENKTSKQLGFRPRTQQELIDRRRMAGGSSRSLQSIDDKLKATTNTFRMGTGRSASISIVNNHTSILDDGFSVSQLDDFLEAIFAQVKGQLPMQELCTRLLLPLTLMGIFTIVLLSISFAVDNVMAQDDETIKFTLSDIWSMSNEPKDTTLPAELVIRIFSVIMMCSLIALQKSASRVVRHVWMLFRSARWVQVIWLLDICAVSFALLNAGFSIEKARPTLSLISVILASLSVMTLYPYFSYFFVFLDENRLLTHVVLQDLRMLNQLSKSSDSTSNVLHLVHSLQRVADFASSTIRVKDKTNAMKSVNALYCIARCYLNVKQNLETSFFFKFNELPELASMSDFARLSIDFRTTISEDRSWVEWKFLRHLLILFQESVGHMAEVCYRIVISTRELAEAAMRKGDLALLDLSIKFLNTFLKIALERMDIRLVYNIMFQYRKLGENIINGRLLSPNNNITAKESDRYVLDIAFFFRHYAHVAQSRGIGFVTELITHDLFVLCMAASRRNAKCHDDLLNISLQSYSKDSSIGRRGVRRAQLKLSAFYIVQKRMAHMEKVLEEILSEDNLDQIIRAYADLSAPEVSLNFWEINERNYNIDHMIPEQHRALRELLERFPENLRDLCHGFESRVHKRIDVKANQGSDRPASSSKKSESTGNTQSLESVFSGFSREIVIRARESAKRVEARDASSVNRKTMRYLGMQKARFGSTMRILSTSNAENGGKPGESPGSSMENLNTGSSMANASQKAWFVVVLLLFIALSATFIAAALDSNLSTAHLFLFLPSTTVKDRQQTLKFLGKASVVIFCIVLTPTLIMLQINSRHLLGVIAEQFFKDRRVAFLLTYYSSAAVYCLAAHYVTTDTYAPRLAVLASGAVVATLICFLFPYFATVFEFLDPHGVVMRMLKHSTKAVNESTTARKPSHSKIIFEQMQLDRLLQQLTGFANASLRDKDKNNLTNVVRVLSTFMEHYLYLKSRLDQRWFDATGRHMRISQDFGSLEPDQLVIMSETRTWVEAKLLRQFLGLFNEALVNMQESCFLIAIETVKIGHLAIEVLDYHTIELVVKMLNTYLRSCLNKRAIRAIYNTLHQYRQFAELLVISSAGQHQPLNKFAISIAQYLRYYGSVAAAMRIEFVVQVIAFDLARMCETAFTLGFDNNVTNDRTLAELLALFDSMQPSTSTANVVSEFERREQVCKEFGNNMESIARASMCLATLYLEMGDQHRADVIIDKLNESCQPNILERARDKIEKCTERDFWEANDRGSNFDFLPESRRAKLMQLFMALRNGEERLRERESALVIRAGADPTKIKSLNMPNSLFAAIHRRAAESRSSGLVPAVNNGPSLATISLAHAAMMRKVKRIRDAREQHEKEQVQIEQDDSVETQALVMQSFMGAHMEESTRSTRHRNSVREMAHATRVRQSRRGSANNLLSLFAGTSKAAQRAHEENMNEGSVVSFTSVASMTETRQGRGAYNSVASLDGPGSPVMGHEVAAAKVTRKKLLPSLVKGGGHHNHSRNSGGGSTQGNRWGQSFLTIPLASSALLLIPLLIQCHFSGVCMALAFSIDDNELMYKLQSDTVRTIALTMITFLGSVVTVSTVVLQIVSTRYTPRVAILFLRNFRIVVSLTTFFGSTLFVELQAVQSSETGMSRIGFIWSIVLMVLSFILLMPYIAHLLRFLDAAHIFREIGHEGLELALADLRGGQRPNNGKPQNNKRRVVPVDQTSSEEGSNKVIEDSAQVKKSDQPSGPGPTENQEGTKTAKFTRQQGVLHSLDQISDFSVTALRLKDKHNAFHGIDLLCAFAVAYIQGKQEIAEDQGLEHTKVSTAVNRDPDFVSMSDAILCDLESQHIWVLWKALRQLLKMYELSLGKFNDAILRIARGLRHIGQAAASCDDMNAAHLCIKFMNTILQLALSQENQRAADTVMVQYRFYCEFILTQRVVHESVVEDDEERISPWSNLICDIIGYFHHYALSSSLTLRPMTGRIIHDMCSLAAFARHFDLKDMKNYIQQEIFTFLLECPIPPQSNGPISDAQKVDHLPREVLRAIFKLASIYISEFGDRVSDVGGDVRKIKVALRYLQPSTLEEVWKDFRTLSFKEDIQVSDRAVNIDSLTPKQVAAVGMFFRSFEVDVTEIESGADVVARLMALKRQSRNVNSEEAHAPPNRRQSVTEEGTSRRLSVASVEALNIKKEYLDKSQENEGKPSSESFKGTFDDERENSRKSLSLEMDVKNDDNEEESDDEIKFAASINQAKERIPKEEGENPNTEIVEMASDQYVLETVALHPNIGGNAMESTTELVMEVSHAIQPGDEGEHDAVIPETGRSVKSSDDLNVVDEVQEQASAAVTTLPKPEREDSLQNIEI